MTTKKLIHPDIIEAMLALGFEIEEKDNCVYFMNNEPYTFYVLYKGQTFQTWHYNDDEQHEGFQRTIKIELNTFPTLSEWLMMLHIGKVISLSAVLKRIKEAEPVSLFEEMADLVKSDANNFKQLMTA